MCTLDNRTCSMLRALRLALLCLVLAVGALPAYSAQPPRTAVSAASQVYVEHVVALATRSTTILHRTHVQPHRRAYSLPRVWYPPKKPQPRLYITLQTFLC